MDAPAFILENGTKVRTANLSGIGGLLVKQKHLDARKPGITGVVTGVVPGHGGDVYWIQHEDNTVGAYCFTEFELDSTKPTRMEILRK